MINLFVGFNPREAVVFGILASGIHARASVSVSVMPLGATSSKKS